MNKSVVDQIVKLSCETKATETAKSYQSKYYFHSDQSRDKSSKERGIKFRYSNIFGI